MHTLRSTAARAWGAARFAAVLSATMLVTTLVTACGSDPGPESAQETRSPVSAPSSEVVPEDSPSVDDPAPPEAPAAVPEILDFEGTTIDGAAFAGASVAGRPVVLWFWAPWCAVCRSQAPTVSDLAAEYGDRLTVLGIGSLDSSEAIAGFADEAPGVTHLSDPDGALWTRFGISEQSSFVVLDDAGEEVLRTGYADDDGLGDAVAEVTG